MANENTHDMKSLRRAVFSSPCPISFFLHASSLLLTSRPSNCNCFSSFKPFSPIRFHCHKSKCVIDARQMIHFPKAISFPLFTFPTFSLLSLSRLFPRSLPILTCRRAVASSRPTTTTTKSDFHHFRTAHFFSTYSASVVSVLSAPWRPFDRFSGDKGVTDTMAPIVTNVEEIAEKYIADNNVMVFSKSYCPFCLKVRREWTFTVAD